MKFRLEDEANEELIQATAYLGKKSPNLAEDFLATITAARTQLLQFPHSGQKIGRNARRLLIKRFPYQLIYRVEADTITVYAVAHLKRSPDTGTPASQT